MSRATDHFLEVSLGSLLALEYGVGLPESARSGKGFPVFGSNGAVGRHSSSLVQGPGIIVGRKGSVGQVWWSHESFWPIDTAYYVVPREQVPLRWIYWLLKSIDLQHLDAATGVPGLNRNDVYAVRAACPPASERPRIAAVLDAVAEAIAKTEGVIAKLKQVRAGLLHDLLTRGLDENGQLRPLPAEAPQLYQDSPLGKIPKGWQIRGVLDLAPLDRQAILTGPFGAQLGQRDFVADGVPVLCIGNVQSGYIDWSDLQFVSQTKATELKRFSVFPGDLLFARQGATTGRNALADKKAAGALINYHIIRVAVDPDLCAPVFLHAIFNSEQAMRQVNRDKGRGTREGINSEQISRLRFALPTIEEQQRAVAILANYDTNGDREAALLVKLHRVKSGLMADLLTGRVRVPEGVEVTT